MKHIPPQLVALSVFLNESIGGEKGFSLCATFYKWKTQNKIRGKVMTFLSDCIFFWDKQHCRKAFHLRSKQH